jgi:hypothetical protein
MTTKSKIYFISAGTSKKDLDRKADKNDLTYYGYKELINLRQNPYFQTEIYKNNNTDFLVSANIGCVESALILFSDPEKKTVLVVPHLNTEKNDKHEYITFFKGNIDKIRGHSHYIENLSFGKNQNLPMLIKDFPNINHNLSRNIDNYKFNSKKFIAFLENMINKNPGRNIVVLCQSYAVKALLGQIKKFSYIRKEKIENSSVFEIEIEASPITYEFCSKFYPTKNNYKPLKIENEKYYYNLQGKNVPLFDKLKNKIPENLVKKENKPVDKANNNIIYDLKNSTTNKNKNNNNPSFSFKKLLHNFNESKQNS